MNARSGGVRKLGPADLVRPEIRAISAYHVAPSAGMVKLDAMENPYPLPPVLRDEIERRIGTVEVNRYPDPSASALKSRMRTAMGVPEGFPLLLGNGSDEIIGMVAQTLARPGAVLLSAEPTFVMYRMYATFAGLRYVGVPLAADFSLDEERFLAAIAEHSPAVVFLSYPNNPTGNLYSTAAIERVLDAAPGLVVVDEAYHAFAGQTFMRRLAEFPSLMVMRTVSKLGLAGLRLGYAAAREEWIREFDKVRPPYNVGALTQAIADVVLGRVDMLEAQARDICVSRESLRARLAQLPGVEVYPSDANFLLARVPDAGRLYEALRTRRVLVKNLDGSHPLLANCLRFTVGTPAENDALLAALTASL